MAVIKFICCAFLIFFGSQHSSVAERNQSSQLTNLAEAGDPDQFLSHYKKITRNLYDQRDYDSLIILTNSFLTKPIAGNWPVKTNLLLDKAIALNATGEIEKAQEYYASALAAAHRQQSSELLAECFFQKGKFHYKTTGADSAIANFNKALEIYRHIGDSVKISNSLAQIGMVYDNNGIYAKALAFYMEALHLDEILQDSLGMASSLNNIAIIYKKQEDLASAENYYRRARVLSEALKDEVSVAIADVNLGLLYKDLGDLNKAETQLNNASSVFKKNKDSYAQAIVYHNLGVVKLEKKEWQQAEDMFQKSLWLARQNKMAKVISKDLLFLGKLYFALQQHTRALDVLSQGLAESIENQLLEEQNEIHEMLARVYRGMGNHDAAFSHFEKHIDIKDSLFNEKNSQIVNRLKTEYEVTRKDLQIEALEKEARLRSGLKKAEKVNLGMLIAFIIILTIFSMTLWTANKNRSKLMTRVMNQKQLLEEQNNKIELAQKELLEKNDQLEKINSDKDEIIGIVAHDLRSPLNQVKGLLSIIKMQTGNHETNKMINLALKSTDILRDRVNRILDVQAINAGKVDVKLERLAPDNILDELLSHFSEWATNKNIKLIKEGVAGTDMFEADRNYLFQVLENLLSNAIKYSPSGKKVWISASSDKERLVFAIKDEGPGIDETEQDKLFRKYTRLSTRPTANEDSSGLGLSIVKKYVDAMGGNVWCESKKGQGASFYVAFDSVKL